MPGWPLQLRHQQRSARSVRHRHQQSKSSLVHEIRAFALPLLRQLALEHHQILPRVPARVDPDVSQVLHR
jgi:hypothetical protein